MFRQMCMPPPMHEAGRAFILHVPTYYPVCRFKKKNILCSKCVNSEYKVLGSQAFGDG